MHFSKNTSINNKKPTLLWAFYLYSFVFLYRTIFAIPAAKDATTQRIRKNVNQGASSIPSRTTPRISVVNQNPAVINQKIGTHNGIFCVDFITYTS